MATEVLTDTTNSDISSATSFPQKHTPYRDNASDILPVRVIVTDPDCQDQIIRVAQALCPFLNKCSNPLTVKALGGGLSNSLFIVGDNETKSVLVRIHPTNDAHLPTIVDRNVENSVSAWLSSQQVGPTYFGRFENGRVEEFYPNHAPLSWKDMPVVGPSHVAPIMARFHAMKVPPNVLSNSNVNGDIFQRVREWTALAETLCQPGQKAATMLDELKKDWQWLEDALFKTTRTNLTEAQQLAQKFLGEIVFTHMDMQSLNLLKDTKVAEGEPPVIKVIDFEYAGFNPRVVDMANTFCEHCDMNNIKADYAKEYPSDRVQNEFVQNYIRSLPESDAAIVLNHLDDPDFLEAARIEVGRYSLVSHMSWAIWSVVQVHMSDVDFDYILYAQHRRDGFEFMRSNFSLKSACRDDDGTKGQLAK